MGYYYNYYLLFFLLHSAASIFWNENEYVNVSGRVICVSPFKNDTSRGPSWPAVNATVSLWDSDVVSGHDLIAKTNTGADGWFQMNGTASDPITSIDPYIVVQTNCQQHDSNGRALFRQAPALTSRCRFSVTFDIFHEERIQTDGLSSNHHDVPLHIWTNTAPVLCEE